MGPSDYPGRRLTNQWASMTNGFPVSGVPAACLTHGPRGGLVPAPHTVSCLGMAVRICLDLLAGITNSCDAGSPSPAEDVPGGPGARPAPATAP
ncbi:MAG: hypothetical protein JWO75_3167, partial [Actinomycetia bacterium]|nr:hypothetical protein [Actinomycetes bacterium]